MGLLQETLCCPEALRRSLLLRPPSATVLAVQRGWTSVLVAQWCPVACFSSRFTLGSNEQGSSCKRFTGPRRCTWKPFLLRSDGCSAAAEAACRIFAHYIFQGAQCGCASSDCIAEAIVSTLNSEFTGSSYKVLQLRKLFMAQFSVRIQHLRPSESDWTMWAVSEAAQ